MNRLRCGSLLVLTLATGGCGPTEGHRAALAETKKLQERIQFLQEDVARVTSEAKGRNAASTAPGKRPPAGNRKRKPNAKPCRRSWMRCSKLLTNIKGNTV